MKTYEELLEENNNLKEEVSSLKAAVDTLEKKNTEAETLVAYYLSLFRMAQARKYAPSSEKNFTSEQLSLFNEAEAEKDSSCDEPDFEEITYKRRKKQKGKRSKQLEKFPTEVIEHKLEDIECPNCHNELHVMKVEERNEIVVIPAQVKVIKHKIYTYSCRHCEREGIEATIIKAEAPNALIPKSLVSPSLLSMIVCNKYVNHLPLNRQEKDFKRIRLDISRTNMANWIIKGAEYLKPLYRELKKELEICKVVHCDETSVEVLHEPGREPQTKSSMWVYCSGKYEKHISLYAYTQTKGGEHVREYLKGFRGYLITDGYNGFNKVEDVTHCGCWAHTRRKFTDFIKTLPKETRDRGETEAHKGVRYIDKIFKIEREIEDKTPEEITEIRDKKSRKVVEEFFEWAESAELLPSSPTAKAINYAKNNKNELCAFLEDGHIEPSNNRAERAIKPFVMGRKNWLFSDVPSGARASAIIYSICQTAILNDLDPWKYIELLFDTLKDSPSELTGLMPWDDNVQLKCRIKTD